MGKAMLVLALGLSSVMGKMLYDINARTFDLSENSYERYTRLVARNIANSGANMAVSELYRDFSWRTGLDTTSYNDGLFTATAVDVTIDTPLTISRALITAIGTYEGISDTATVVVAQPAFSYFGLFSDSWPSSYVDWWPYSAYFVTSDTLYGPIHSNGELNYAGYPVFMGKVTSAYNSYNTYGATDPKFHAGYELDTPAIALPNSVPALIDSANSGGDVYNDHVWLIFNADGTYFYDDDADTTNGYGTKNLSDYNGTIMTLSGSGDRDIHVQGTVHGQVTIYSEDDIFIEDDLIYSDDPRSNAASQDMLGLIAEQDIQVEDNIANQSDCEIHAAIMALNNSLEVENYGSGSPRGTFTVLGSIVQRDLGQLGEFSYGTVLHGYDPDFQYDKRFLTVAPPHFPLQSRIVVLSWNE